MEDVDLDDLVLEVEEVEVVAPPVAVHVAVAVSTKDENLTLTDVFFFTRRKKVAIDKHRGVLSLVGA